MTPFQSARILTMKLTLNTFTVFLCLFAIAFVGCDDTLEEGAISLDDIWQIENIEGFVLADACPPEDTATLRELLFAICTNGTPIWEATSTQATGSCFSPDFPNPPSPASNPNPNGDLVRINMVAGCEHDSFADEAGCIDGSNTERFIIEYRNGLFPTLPQPFTTYCPLVATPISVLQE